MKHVLANISNINGKWADTRLYDQDLKENGFSGAIISGAFKLVSYKDLFSDSSYVEAPNQIEGQKEVTDCYDALNENNLDTFVELHPFILPKELFEFLGKKISGNPKQGDELFNSQMQDVFCHQLDQIIEKLPDLSGVVVPIDGVSFNTSEFQGGNIVDKLSDFEEGVHSDKLGSMLRFLVKAICEQRRRTLIFRVYSNTFDKLHNDPDFYMETLKDVVFSKKFIVSFTHDEGGFTRWNGFPRPLGLGRHHQIIEVDCVRHNEGQAAFPNYLVKGVADGFGEMSLKKGLNSIRGNHNWVGLILHGMANSLTAASNIWRNLNVHCLKEYVNDPTKLEPAIFREFALGVMGLEGNDAILFREIAVLSESAVLKTLYCAVYDRNRGEGPATNGWICGRKLGGLPKLIQVFDFIIKQSSIEAALREKKEAIEEWHAVLKIANSMKCEGLAGFKNNLVLSIKYGLHLAEIISNSWEILLRGYSSRWVSNVNFENRAELIVAYDLAWDNYRSLKESSSCGPLFEGAYNDPNTGRETGLSVSVEDYRYFGYESYEV